MVQGAPVSALQAEFVWSQVNCVDADEAATGKLRLFVGGQLIWGIGDCGVHWHWVDLLEGLSEDWPTLLYEGWLEGLQPRDGSAFNALERYQSGVEMQASVGDISNDDAIALQDDAYAWEQAHFLSRFMPGLGVPDVAIWGDKGTVYLETAQFKGGVPRTRAAAALSELGDAIARRLEAQGFEQHPAVEAWRGRHVPATDRFAANATGEDELRLRFAWGTLQEAEVWGGSDGQMADTVWAAAAQACRGADREVLRDLFQSLANLPPASGAWLDCLDVAGRARQAVGAYGPILAREARGMAGLGAAEPLAIDALARGLGRRNGDAKFGRDRAGGECLDEGPDARQQFACSQLSEGDRGDGFGGDAIGQHHRNAASHDGCLSGTGAGLDENGAVMVKDGGTACHVISKGADREVHYFVSQICAASPKAKVTAGSLRLQ